MPPKTRAAKRLAIASGINIQLQSLLPARRPRQIIQPPPLVIPPIEMIPDIIQPSILDMGPLPPPGHIPDKEWQFDNHRSTNYVLNIFDTYIVPGGVATLSGPTFTEVMQHIPDYHEFAILDAEREAAMVEPLPVPEPVRGIYVKLFILFHK